MAAVKFGAVWALTERVQMRSIDRKLIGTAGIVLAGCVAATLLYCVSIGHGDVARAGDPRAAVEGDVAQVIAKDISDWQSYSERLEAIDHADIHALVPGTISEIYFH